MPVTVSCGLRAGREHVRHTGLKSPLLSESWQTLRSSSQNTHFSCHPLISSGHKPYKKSAFLSKNSWFLSYFKTSTHCHFASPRHLMTTPFFLSSNKDKIPQVLQSRAISLSKLGLPQRHEALSAAVTRSYISWKLVIISVRC